MKDLKINNNTTLCSPDEDGEVQICLITDRDVHREYVSFEELEKWVALIREQIITSSNEQAKYCNNFRACKFYKTPDCGNWCKNYPPVG